MILILSFTIFLSLTLTPTKTSTTTFIYAACAPSHYLPNTPFQSNLNSLLTSLANSAPNKPYNSFASGTPSTVYGLYQCRNDNDLTPSECSSCVDTAVAQIGLLCPEATAAALQLDACLVRYSDEDFRGRLEESVVYRKCSREEGNEREFLRWRDGVLGELGNGRGFKVSRVGGVEGYAQCVGDLSEGDCRTCLGRAVGEIRSACGKSVAADLFMGQCYVRFWASGYYPRPAETSENTDDDIGRTVAIIVGILAGVAFLMVFISFLKRAC